MFPITTLRRGAFWGVVIAFGYFCADALGTTLAIGFLFDAKPAQWILLAVAVIDTLLAGALVGTLVAFICHKLPWKLAALPRKLAWGAAIAAFVTVTVLGYQWRIGRQQPLLDNRPPFNMPKPPSVLWITIDTLRADTLYGEQLDFPNTPGFAEFAKQSLVFTDAESAAGWTIPSTATMLTGIHPESLYSNRGFLPDWAPTAAERLRAVGYETHAVVDNILIEPRTGFGAGFETFFQRSALGFAFTFPGMRLLPTRWREALREMLPVFYYGAPGVTNEAVRIIETPRNTPVFLYVHYMDVHYPYYFHPELGPDPANVEEVKLYSSLANIREVEKFDLNPQQLAFLQHRYKNELRALDQHLTRLITTFKKHLGDTVVVVTSDHGEEFMEHGGLGHGHTLYKELVHVPLVLHVPSALLANNVGLIREPFGHVDLLPTLIDLLKVDINAGTEGYTFEGSSWGEFLRNIQVAPSRVLFAAQSRNQRRVYRMRYHDRAFVQTWERGVGKTEFFDKKADYSERQDVLETRRNDADVIQKELTALIDQQVAARDPVPSTAESNRETLKALGYVQ